MMRGRGSISIQKVINDLHTKFKNRDWVGWAGRSKKGCSPFKLILHQFSTAISPLTKFHQNQKKNAVENFCQSVDFNGLSR